MSTIESFLMFHKLCTTFCLLQEIEKLNREVLDLEEHSVALKQEVTQHTLDAVSMLRSFFQQSSAFLCF